MKSWKGWSDGKFIDLTKDGGDSPVLVIDASDFPSGYPEIGSEWVDDEGDHHTVESAPAYVCGEWVALTTCTDADGTKFPYYARIANLKPIPEEPETATGEVVATVLVEGGAIKSFTLPDDGTYDIIRRGDK